MPIALEPGVLFPIVLDSDMVKPESERPAFLVPALSMRDQTKFESEMDSSLGDTNTTKLFDATCELLSKYVRGWRNMGPFVYGESDLRDVLSYGEARELLRKILANQHAAADEKKV